MSDIFYGEQSGVIFMQLSVHHLTFERNQRFLFENLSFSLNAGELLQLRGANGSGKSTLLRMLAGLIEPQEGKICWNGVSVQDHCEDYQQALHYLGHQNGVKTYLTIDENLQLLGSLYHQRFSEQTLADTLRQLGLSQSRHTPVANLSAGQARRLSLAKLLLLRAPLWLLDEPATALDQPGQTVLAELLATHAAQGGSAIIATHQALNIPRTLWLGEPHA